MLIWRGMVGGYDLLYTGEYPRIYVELGEENEKGARDDSGARENDHAMIRAVPAGE